MELFIIFSCIVMVSGTFNIDYGTFGVRGTIEGSALIQHQGYHGSSMPYRGSYPEHMGFRTYDVTAPIGTIRDTHNKHRIEHAKYSYRGPTLHIPPGNHHIPSNEFFRDDKSEGIRPSFAIHGPQSMIHQDKTIPVGVVRQGFVGALHPAKNTLHDNLSGFPKGNNFASVNNINPVNIQSGNVFTHLNGGPFQTMGFKPIQSNHNMVRIPQKVPEFDGKPHGEIYKQPVIQGHFRSPNRGVGPDSLSVIPKVPVRLREWEYSGGEWGGKNNILPVNTWGGNSGMVTVGGNLPLHPGQLSNMFVNGLRTY